MWEDPVNVFQIHGIVVNSNGERVTITDGHSHVYMIHTGMKELPLNADEARYLSQELLIAAERLDKRLKYKP